MVRPYRSGYQKRGFDLPSLIEEAKRAQSDHRLFSTGRWFFESRTPWRLVKERIALAQHSNRGTFLLDGREYRYPTRPSYLLSERAVEIPFSTSFLENHPNGRILEVGNVMSGVMALPQSYDVVDKYEVAEGVINVDVLDYAPDSKYDLILSISTLEHIGFDEATKDSRKPLRVVEHLSNLLRPGGSMLITVPTGYNPAVDDMISRNSGHFSQMLFLKRVSYWGFWTECSREQALATRYATKYQNANAAAFLIKVP